MGDDELPLDAARMAVSSRRARHPKAAEDRRDHGECGENGTTCGHPASSVLALSHRSSPLFGEAPAPLSAAGGCFYVPAQTALAWILTRGDDIAPIPGTRRVARVEENTAAETIQLTEAQLHRLDNLKPAAGARHDYANMASIDR